MEPGEELADVWGIATTTDGHILVWDAGNERIVALNSELVPVTAIGRRGTGPGEFAYQHVPHGNWIAAGDSSFVVLGLTNRFFAKFQTDGTFLGSPTLMPPDPFAIARISILDERVVYSVDNLNPTTGERVWETWRLETDGPHDLLRSDTMPPVPLWHGKPLIGSPFFDQANPLWGLDRGCAYISTGGDGGLVRAELSSGASDTLPLPRWNVPERTEEDRDRAQRARTTLRTMGADVVPEGSKPTLRAKWADLVVDPDGFVWLKPWRPSSYQDQPIDALIINPTTGAADSITVPRFPAAFLPGGRFVALAFAGDAGVPVVQEFGPR